MLTLMHEDIYVYVDPIIPVSETKTATNTFTFANDAVEQVSDIGIFTINVSSGDYTKVVVKVGDKTTTINVPLTAGETFVANFRDLYFSKDDSIYFPTDDIVELKDNSKEDIVITLTGSGSATVERMYNKAQINDNDVWFVDSISVDHSFEQTKKVLYDGSEKNVRNEKKTYSFSINGLWSQKEIDKFTDLFRVRLVDEEGTKLETLANCTVNSLNYSSSSGGDFTYAISGSCEKIF